MLMNKNRVLRNELGKRKVQKKPDQDNGNWAPITVFYPVGNDQAAKISDHFASERANIMINLFSSIITSVRNARINNHRTTNIFQNDAAKIFPTHRVINARIRIAVADQESLTDIIDAIDVYQSFAQQFGFPQRMSQFDAVIADSRKKDYDAALKVLTGK